MLARGGSRGTAVRVDAPWGCETTEDCAFALGYVDAGAPLAYLRHLLEDVRPCEGAWGVVYENGYVSSFQFDPGSWATAAGATGFRDELDPYAVGRNVGWWVQRVDPGSTAGWPVCWWRGELN